MKTKSRYKFLVASLIINALLGVLYAWSLFLIPLESLLANTRAEISVAPSVALLCVTIGVLCHDHLLRILPLTLLAPTVLVLAGLGYFIFWLAPSYQTLVIGYGLMFGFAAGVGFGIALALARIAERPANGWFVGLVAAMFAASGMAVSFLGAELGMLDPVFSFGLISVVFSGGALLIFLILRGETFPSYNSKRNSLTTLSVKPLGFWFLFVGNFAVCYAGLMFISHGSAMLTSFGLTPGLAALAPLASNMGYVLGALFGGVLAARFIGKSTPFFFAVVTLIAIVTLNTGSSFTIKIVSLWLIGVAFGSTVSVFMMLFTVWYGVERAGLLFGRLNAGYGIAGFVAPWLTGVLYDRSGDYHDGIFTCAIVVLTGLLAITLSPRPR